MGAGVRTGKEAECHAGICCVINRDIKACLGTTLLDKAGLGFPTLCHDRPRARWGQPAG